MSKELVSRWLNKISESEKNKPLLILGGFAYTPRQAYDEVMRGTPTGDQLQNLIEQGRYGTTVADENALIKQRLQTSLLSKPQDKILFVALPSSGLPVKAYTPAQLLDEIKRETAVGKQWMEGEKKVMLRVLQVR